MNQILPIDSYISAIKAALEDNQVLLVQAEPGAGKTTRLPASLLEDFSKGILVLEPRRLAAKLSAERVAKELGEVCGDSVGYQVRFERKLSSGTRLRYVTEGIFLRYLEHDPTLSKFGLIILDEFHERNIYSDLALMLIRQLQKSTRPDLRLIVASATLATESLIKYTNSKAVFKISGRNFPLTVSYKNLDLKCIDEEAIVQACEDMLELPECPGNILVFLVGIAQILAIASKLGKQVKGRCTVVPLSAELPRKEQEKAFDQKLGKKIILATNVAETSLTIPDVTGVIDPGFAKIAAYASWSGMPTLEVQGICRDSAVQRAGRAGRTRAGKVIRLYSESEFLRRPLQTLPDIQRLDFAPYLLDLLALDQTSVFQGEDIAKLPWFEAPNTKVLAAAFATLKRLRAVGEDEKITEFGLKVAEIPLHPRLAAICVAGLERSQGQDALLAACLISEGGVIIRGQRRGRGNCDVSIQLDLIKAIKFKTSFETELDLDDYTIDHSRVNRILQLYKNLAKPLALETTPSSTPTDSKGLAYCLLAGYPDRVAKRRIIKRKQGKNKKTRDDLYHFCLGRGGYIADQSFLGLPDYVIAIEAREHLQRRASQGTLIHIGATVHVEQLKQDPGKMITQTTEESNDLKQAVKESNLQTYYGDFLIESLRIGSTTSLQGDELSEWIQQNWPKPFQDTSFFEEYMERVRTIKHYGLGMSLSLFEGDLFALLWDSICSIYDSLEAILAVSLEEHIISQLGVEESYLLESLAPRHMQLPNGKSISIRYEQNKACVQAYIQDFYGVKELPHLVEGRCPIKIEFIAPNKRPCQITEDLAGFWQGSYPSLVKELSRRYPKHHWPLEPLSAKPVLLKRFAGNS
ncbi:MAG: ATP-dependent helicase C-terminal domain-containing protein [Oligoflexales bacterium]